MILSVDDIRSRHLGRDAFVIGSGSSLDHYPPDFFHGRLTIGMNEVCRRVRCSYTVTVHHEFFPSLMDCQTRFVVSEYMHCLKEKGSPALDILGKDRLLHWFFTHPENGFGAINYPENGQQFPAAGTCTIPALALAKWLGVRTVFLCGVDGVVLRAGANYDGYPGMVVPLDGGYQQHLDQTRHLYHELIKSWGNDGPEVVGINPFLDFHSVPR